MINRSIIGAIALFVSAGQAIAMCEDGVTAQCTINGKKGARECVNGRWTSCIIEEPETQATSGILYPKYVVLTVVYAPPGTQSGKSSSSVVYGSGSTAGTTTSASNSFKQNYSVSVTAGGGFLGSVEATAGFGYGKTSTDSKSLDIKKTANLTIQDGGPGIDGVDHDHDLIYLWLNPAISVSLTPEAASWTLTGTQSASIQYVYVGWLKHPDTMPLGVKQALQSHNITEQDFPDIMARDPYANGNPSLNTVRYQQLYTTFPYEPPYASGDPVPTLTFNVTNAATSTTGTSAQDSYKVSLSIKAGVDFLGMAKSSLKTDDSWEWTNTSSKSDSSGSSQSATVTVGGPAFGYSGPTEMAVYYDSIYKTFFFQPINYAPTMKGKLLSRSGKPKAMQEVTVTANGVRYRTFSNSAGEYRVYGPIRGRATVKTGSIERKLSNVRPGSTFNLKAD